MQVLVDIAAAASSGRADAARQQRHSDIGAQEIDTIDMGRPRLMKIIVGIAASAAIAAGGLGLAASANAAPALPAPTYHWCPGEFWNPIWGFNWEFGECHDDFHRDRDGDWHDRDWHGDRGDWHDRDHDRGDWRGHDHDWRP